MRGVLAASQKMKRLLKFILPILVIGLGVAFFQHLLDTRAAPETVSESLPPPVVSAMVVRPQILAPELTLFGRVEAPSNSILRAGIAADVVQVFIQEGDIVEAGDVLIELDDSDTALEVRQHLATVAETEAQIRSDQRAYEADQEALERELAMLELTRNAVARARALASTNAGTWATLDETLHQEEQLLLAITQRRRHIDDYPLRQKRWQARLEHAQAILDHAKLALSRTQIRAPYSGRVIEVLVSPGDRASRDTAIVRMFDHRNLEVRSQVPLRYTRRIEEAVGRDEEVMAVLRDDYGGARLRLDRLAASIEPGQGGLDMFLHAASGVLPALGSTVELVLQLPPLDGAIALPQTAVYGNDRVYRIRDNRLQALTVRQLGYRMDKAGQQELIMDASPFQEGELLMISRLPQAIEGLQITPDVINE